MGIYGAELATAIGSGISFLVMLTHFVRRKNTLRLIKPENLFGKMHEIFITGFSTFFIDVAMGILTVLFNRQIMKYLGANALAIYGPIINISTFVQCCAYSVGQAAQPIISTNFGARKGERIKETLRLALWTTTFFGIFWTALSVMCPNLYIRIFMSPTPEILDMAPAIVRTYALSFLLLPFVQLQLLRLLFPLPRKRPTPQHSLSRPRPTFTATPLTSRLFFTGTTSLASPLTTRAHHGLTLLSRATVHTLLSSAA